jgi:hypothetical protein
MQQILLVKLVSFNFIFYLQYVYQGTALHKYPFLGIMYYIFKNAIYFSAQFSCPL